MVRAAAALGTTVFPRPDKCEQSGRAAAELVHTSTRLPEIIEAYRTIENAVTGPGFVSPAVPPLVGMLVETASKRLPEHPVHARSLLLLGILAERTEQDWSIVVDPLLRAVRPDWPEATALAAAYLFAHFPADADDIEAALSATVLSEPDLARLRRCLARPASGDQLGRVWPSPTTWTLTAAERDRDEQWRATLNLTTDTVASPWQSETTALLAYMGAKADHAVERSCDA
jgi:hypothetical protein